MNLNFDEIITKANARKDALMALQTHMAGIEPLFMAIRAQDAWAIELRSILARLDPEAVELITHPVFRALSHLIEGLTAPLRNLSYTDASSSTPLKTPNNDPRIVNLQKFVGKTL